jgi:hypothetical protein
MRQGQRCTPILQNFDEWCAGSDMQRKFLVRERGAMGCALFHARQLPMSPSRATRVRWLTRPGGYTLGGSVGCMESADAGD